MDKITFELFSKDIYIPLIEKRSEELNEVISAILTQFAVSGFPLPPGAMYAKISKSCKDDLPIRAKMIFDGCCQSYKCCENTPRLEEFNKEIAEAITLEAKRLAARANQILKQQHVRFKIPHFEAHIEYNENEISSEGRRLVRYYAAQAAIFVKEAMPINKVENPFEVKPKLFGFGVDLIKFIPWAKHVIKRK